MQESLSHEEFTRMIVTLWAIWSAHWKAIHEDIFQSPLPTHCFISSYLWEIEILQKATTTRAAASAPRLRQWFPPPAEHATINVDAVVARDGGYGAVWAIFLDQRGSFLGASAVVFRNIDDSAILETLATEKPWLWPRTYIFNGYSWRPIARWSLKLWRVGALQAMEL